MLKCSILCSLSISSASQVGQILRVPFKGSTDWIKLLSVLRLCIYRLRWKTLISANAA